MVADHAAASRSLVARCWSLTRDSVHGPASATPFGRGHTHASSQSFVHEKRTSRLGTLIGERTNDRAGMPALRPSPSARLSSPEVVAEHHLRRHDGGVVEREAAPQRDEAVPSHTWTQTDPLVYPELAERAHPVRLLSHPRLLPSSVGLG